MKYYAIILPEKLCIPCFMQWKKVIQKATLLVKFPYMMLDIAGFSL